MKRRCIWTVAFGLASTFWSTFSYAAESAACLSSNPADWPAPSKPYFMLAIDTSGSMTSSVSTSNSCGYSPNDRNAHSRCAMKNTVQAFSGDVNFGLATFAVLQEDCNSSCYSGCNYYCFDEEFDTTGICAGCGPRTGNASTRAGAFIRVPMLQDHFWSNPPDASNASQLVSWADNSCGSSVELFAAGNTPLNGMLRDMKRYFASGWTSPDGSISYTTPLSTNDLAGDGVNGSTSCRSINVILQTDGDETCDTQSDAVAAAADLYNNGVTVGGHTYKIRTFVINFVGGNKSNTDAIAAAGGTSVSYYASNEVELSQALTSIIAGTVEPEVCDNTDNNCNGCTDEGFTHYCNVQQTCCTGDRETCLSNYRASISDSNPSGDLTLLPCTTVTQQTTPSSWLCYDPGETCDSVDNNCQDGADENVTKCGDPAHCPTDETCNGLDDNCDGQVDEGVCNGCIPSAEICDGCDNDCNGIADDGIDSIPCGLVSPANCVGTLTCKTPQSVPAGTCVSDGGWNTCDNNPQTETCDDVDNDCDGIVDDNIASEECVPSGTSSSLVYGGSSQCKKGSKACNGSCQGFVGPSQELCDGVDNDCDGTVDEDVPGTNQSCGVNQPPCSPGKTACVNGALVCQGGQQPESEICDGLDNDCDTFVDESPLADAPSTGENGCWTIEGSCCAFSNLTWCPPDGANCFDNGSLTPPCNHGTLACAGSDGWICQNAKEPSEELCDGLDNNCDGDIDEEPVAQTGAPCGSDIGECQMGTLKCFGGVLDCDGDVPPSDEVCDGLDNDCDENIDNGIITGGPCTVDYDTTEFPGPRDNLPCQPGVLVCDGNGGVVCEGGVGPSAELCDGIDNDCDGSVDEAGAAPDGTNGSANPNSPPEANIGDACGESEGQCTQGTYACVNGLFACIGAQTQSPEECDCIDNDCDGTIDNEDPDGNPLCSEGKDCVKAGGKCLCAQKCSGGEYPCPGGQTCESATTSDGSEPLGNYCVSDVCNDCEKQTVKDSNGNIVCAPKGTTLDNCITPPVCTCQGQFGCQEPCLGVTCDNGLVCSNFGTEAGTCVVDNCFNAPCQGCGKACNLGSCVDNPCTALSCPANVCKPNDNFTSFTCVGSCAEVTCETGSRCVDGTCKPTCDPACADGTVCDESQDPPTCVADQCDPNPCTDGSCCNSLTGACGNCPCEGVICPDGQECSEGNCISSTSHIDGTIPLGTTSSQGGSTGTSTEPNVGNTPEEQDDRVWGLATGGGGCSCDMSENRTQDFGAPAVAALAFILTRRRKQANSQSRKEKQS